MSKKEQLLDLIQHGQKEIMRFAASLSEAERIQEGTLERWSSRDLLAHTGEWRRIMARRLQAYQAGHDVTDELDFDARNEMIFNLYRKDGWEEVLGHLESAHKALVDEVQAFSEDALEAAPCFPWQNNRPLWWLIAVNGYIHPLSHIGPAYVERGQSDYAAYLYQEEYRLVSAMDDQPNWQGLANYNLACHHAQAGNKAAALEHLEPALHQYSRLIEWSQDDSDLACLHDDPDFLNLLERVKRSM